jgi:hypothetical protein
MQWFYDGGAKTEADYVRRLDFLSELLTPQAKSAALQQLFAPPAEASEEVVGKCLQRLLEIYGDANLRASAIKAIVDVIDEDTTPRPSVVEMIRARGDGLPEEVRRAFLRKVPES